MAGLLAFCNATVLHEWNAYEAGKLPPARYHLPEPWLQIPFRVTTRVNECKRLRLFTTPMLDKQTIPAALSSA